MKVSVFWILLAGVISAPLEAQHLPFPASRCKLTPYLIDEYIESFPMRRLRLSGCLSFISDSPRHCLIPSQTKSNSAILLEDCDFQTASIELWIYDDTGPTMYDDSLWNRIVEKSLKSLEEGFVCQVEIPFDLTVNTGTPILGYVSTESEIVLVDKETGQQIRIRCCLVPIEGEDSVLLAVLTSSERQFGFLNKIFEGFVRSLYLESGSSQ